MLKFGLAVLLSCLIGLDEKTWVDTTNTYTTQYWTLRTDLSSDDARDAGKLFDAVYVAYRNGLSMLPEQREVKLEAWVFHKRSDYADTLRFFGATPENSGGMFIGSIGITAVDVSGSWNKFESTAKHEAFHQFASTRFPYGMPAWLSEGLAEYFESTAYINGAIINGQVSSSTLQQLQNDIQSGSCIRFLELMQMSQQTWNTRLVEGNGAMQYRQSWAMVHFLIHANNGQYASQFDRYLLLLSEGMNHAKAFVNAFGTDDLVSFERDWANFINNLKPSSAKTAAHRLNFLASGMHELMQRERNITTLQNLQAALQSIGYKVTLSVNYKENTYDANDSNNYIIEPDSLSSNPHFVFKPRNPFPEIYTSGLEPFNLYVHWFRKDEKIGWTIEVGN